MIQPFTPALFFNHCFDKRRFQHFIYWFFRKSRYGHSRTLQFLEKLKSLGFQSATEAGFSISIEDLKIPSSKSSILFTAENIFFEAELKNTSSCLTSIEKSQQILEIWNRTSERLKHQVLRSFQISDFLNPVYLMAFSGARGNISQIRQLIGMRGLMADPQGQIVDFPIRSNFREGLTLTEYLISCSGARKGIVDTALRTAASGYLTRRLVDVAHHVIIGQLDCQTSTGIVLEDLYDQDKKILTLKERLIGRILAENIYYKEKEADQISRDEVACSPLFVPLIGSKNQEVTQKLSLKICQYRQKVLIRSPLTCESSQFTCQLCYGWNLAEGQCVSIGEAIGILAAQSIGEPGTQLTMRTFHTGGVFTGTLTDQTYASITGQILYPYICPGLLTRTQLGQIAFLTKKKSVLKILPLKEKFLHSKRKQHLQQFFLVSFSRPFFWKKNQLHKRYNPHGGLSFHKKSSNFSLQFQNQIKKLSFKLQCITSITSITSIRHQLFFKNIGLTKRAWVFQASTLLYVRQGETVEKQQLISEIPSNTGSLDRLQVFENEQEILSSVSGEIFFENFIFLEKTKFDINSNILFHQKTVQSFGEFWILFGRVLQTPKGPMPTFFKKYDVIGQVPCSQILIKSDLENLKFTWNKLASAFEVISFQKNLKISKNIDFIFFKRKGYIYRTFRSTQGLPQTLRVCGLALRAYASRVKAPLREAQAPRRNSLDASLKAPKKWKGPYEGSSIFYTFQNQQSSFFQLHASCFVILLNRQGIYSQKASRGDHTFYPKIHFSKTLVKYNFNTLENIRFSWKKRTTKSTRIFIIPKSWYRKSFLDLENIQWIFSFLFYKKSQLLPTFPKKMERQTVQWKPLFFYSSKPLISLLSLNEWNKQLYKTKILPKMRIGTFSFLRISIFLMAFRLKKNLWKLREGKDQTAKAKKPARGFTACKRKRKAFAPPLGGPFDKFFIKQFLSKSSGIVISKKLIQKILLSFIFQSKPIRSSIHYSIQEWFFFGEGSLEKQKKKSTSTYFKKFMKGSPSGPPKGLPPRKAANAKFGLAKSAANASRASLRGLRYAQPMATRGEAACDLKTLATLGPLLQYLNFLIRNFIFKQDKFCRFFIRKEILDFYFDFFYLIIKKFNFLKNLKTRFNPIIPTKPISFIYEKTSKKKQTKNKATQKRIVNKNKKIQLKEYSNRFQKSRIACKPFSQAWGWAAQASRVRLTGLDGAYIFYHLPHKNLENSYSFWIPSKKNRIAFNKIKLKIFSYIKKRIFKKQSNNARLSDSQARKDRTSVSKKSRLYRFNRIKFYRLLWTFQIKIQGISPIYKKFSVLKSRGVAHTQTQSEPTLSCKREAFAASLQFHTVEQSLRVVLLCGLRSAQPIGLKALYLNISTLNIQTLRWDALINQQKNKIYFEVIYKKTHFRCFENQIWIRYFLPTQMGEILEMIIPKKKEQEILVLEFSDLFSYEYKNPFEKNKNEFFNPNYIYSPSSKKKFKKKTYKFLGSFFRTGEEFVNNRFVLMTGQMIAKTERSILFRKAYSCLFNDQSVLYVKHGEVLSKDQRLCTVFYNQPRTGDIVQGIPKIEEIFEARKKSKYSLHKLAIFSKDFLNFEKKISQYLRSLQKSIVNNIQRIYCGQGIYISDKHIEVIVRQMTSNAWIVDPGQTGLLYGEILPLQWIERINSLLISNQVLYEPILLGMTKTCLEASSFLSAASFQETTRVLGRAALQNQIDFIRGLKQNIILGNFIPAGTGCFGQKPKF